MTDLSRAVLLCAESPALHAAQFEAFNMATVDTITVNEVFSIVRQTLLSDVPSKAASDLEERGWLGDIGTIVMPVDKISRLGWRASMTSREAVLRAVREIAADS